MQVKQAITINGAPEELYRFWRDFQNLPRFMTHLESVQTTEQTIGPTGNPASGQATSQTMRRPNGDGRSHWVAKALAGRTVEWDAEITEDRPNELIAWRVASPMVKAQGRIVQVIGPDGKTTKVDSVS